MPLGAAKGRAASVRPPLPLSPSPPRAQLTPVGPARRQPFALAVEHEQLKQRVAILEAVLQRLAPDVYHEIALDMPVLPVPPRPVHVPAPAKAESVVEDDDDDEDDDEQESDGENVEDAALVLEELGASLVLLLLETVLS